GRRRPGSAQHARRSRRTRRPSHAWRSGSGARSTRPGGRHGCARPWRVRLWPVLCPLLRGGSWLLSRSLWPRRVYARLSLALWSLWGRFCLRWASEVGSSVFLAGCEGRVCACSVRVSLLDLSYRTPVCNPLEGDRYSSILPRREIPVTTGGRLSYLVTGGTCVRACSSSSAGRMRL